MNEEQYLGQETENSVLDILSLKCLLDPQWRYQGGKFISEKITEVMV